jgi:hypothetical protein
MAGSRQTNTFGEMLQKLLRDLADMKVAPDADLPFIVDLETQVIAKLREPIDGAPSQVQGDPMLGQAIGMQGQMPSPMDAMPPAEGVAGVRSMPTMPNPDELRRMLATR